MRRGRLTGLTWPYRLRQSGDVLDQGNQDKSVKVERRSLEGERSHGALVPKWFKEIGWTGTRREKERLG